MTAKKDKKDRVLSVRDLNISFETASGTVRAIRAGIGDLPGCAAVNVYATHTHAGPDTLVLWGPVGADGKNAAYMEALVAYHRYLIGGREG